ncbi:hypothetical protein DFQ29_005855 [Apophysomyces sp. BC1021]|nr:hypothetical protein DFQ29_005855 [Apophysomyces sp. BC1021]
MGFEFLIETFRLAGFQSGVYGHPPLSKQLKRWSKQLLVYITGLILMKALIIVMFHACPWTADFGHWVLQWTMDNYRLQVVFVMLIFPLVMNIIQFWLVDTIVKHDSDKKPIRLSRDEEDTENLLVTNEYSEAGLSITFLDSHTVESETSLPPSQKLPNSDNISPSSTIGTFPTNTPPDNHELKEKTTINSSMPLKKIEDQSDMSRSSTSEFQSNTQTIP